jgi:hypothetical protein
MNDEDKKTALDHLRQHITYPASADEIKKACNDMEDVPEGKRTEFLATLPDGTYNSADEVIKAVGW